MSPIADALRQVRQHFSRAIAGRSAAATRALAALDDALRAEESGDPEVGRLLGHALICVDRAREEERWTREAQALRRAREAEHAAAGEVDAA